MGKATRKQLANAIRALAMDAVQQANSGHPGMPMGMADMAEVLWNDFLRHNPNNPDWWNRDRFVVSNGHGSMLLYSLLHLAGYDLPMEELKNFRQLHSKTPGHPEFGMTPGVETTTGPLGQGLANAVGMAWAEKILAHRFNRPGHNVVDHYTYVFTGDGCLMEGISHEACSLAGTHQLGKLIVLYDDNGISIDGDVSGWLTDNTPQRFEAYRWHVIPDIDGHNPGAIKAAIQKAKTVTDRPSLLCCKTTIGFGSPNLAGTAKTHGSPLGDDEIAATRKQIGWEHAPFVIPGEIYAGWDAKEAGAKAEANWQTTWTSYQNQHPELAEEFERRMKGEFPANWSGTASSILNEMQQKPDKLATRKSSLACLNAIGPHLPELIGGSADLTGSNNTLWSHSKGITAENADGNYIYFGVREFGMSAIANGMSLHGGCIPYVGTFLVFSDYARNAVRLSALMGTRVVYVYTHDSIGLGEDGPTHQPVEHLEALRLIPKMQLWRPCDTAETAAAWLASLEHNGPTCLALTRQGLPPQPRDEATLAAVYQGGYTLVDCDGTPEAVLIATGSEVQLAVEAAEQLKGQGRKVRVVSMPCRERFDAQPEDYRNQVLPPDVSVRVAIEAGVPHVWRAYVGPKGRVLGIDQFGESAPAPEVFAHFGLTTENVVQTTQELINLHVA
ncbi:MAG: transketolase [Deltaproteobacteria bacterium]|nr:MAG: transketolase [Deltaproteobacteria bacterium]